MTVREKFEAWMDERHPNWTSGPRNFVLCWIEESNQYHDPNVQFAFEAFCAASSSQGLTFRWEGKRECFRRSLEALISAISERCYCAGWMPNIEHCMWEYLVGKRTINDSYGQGYIFESELSDMKTFALLLREWPAWDDEKGFGWKPIDDAAIAKLEGRE